MRAKKTLSGTVPDSHLVNSLKADFQPRNYQISNHTFKLDWRGMKHILQRHHPEFWDGSVKNTQSYFNAKVKMDELQNAITSVIKQNRERITKEITEKGINSKFPIYGEYNGVSYRLGFNKGRIGQLYPIK